MSDVENASDSTVTAAFGYNSGNSFNSYNMPGKDSLLRIDELKKAMEFLKDEQKRMLNNLHLEIASLQAKNRGTVIQK